jgi:hypothetical protein
MVLRQMCGAGAQVNPDENLMNLLIYCPDLFEAFFGIEHERFFNELIEEGKFEPLAAVNLLYGHTAELAFAMYDWIQRHVVAAKQPMIDILKKERQDQVEQANFEEAEGLAVAGDDFDQVGQDASYREEYD